MNGLAVAGLGVSASMVGEESDEGSADDEVGEAVPSPGGSEFVVGAAEESDEGSPDDEVGEAVASPPGGSEFVVGVGVAAGSVVTGSAPSPSHMSPHGSS